MISAIVIPARNDHPIRIEQIENSDLGTYRRLVGGNLEILTIERPRATIYLNEEGKLDQLPTNSRATALLWTHNSAFRGEDTIVGDAFIVGEVDRNGDDLTVPDDLVQLLLRTQQYRVEMMTLGHNRWKPRDDVFDDWFAAYVSAVNLALRWKHVDEVRVVPERRDEVESLINQWYALGKKNTWISRASDPDFTRQSFYECHTLDELADKLTASMWAVGAAFFYRDVCFIQQVDGGDEWLTIRHGVAFESITVAETIERGEFPALIQRFLAATKEQCESLKY